MFIWPYFYLALPSIASSPRADCFEAFNTISAGPRVFHSHLSLVGGPKQTPVGACSLFSKDLQPQPKACYSLHGDTVAPPAPFTPFPPSVGGMSRMVKFRVAARALSLCARRPHCWPKPHGLRLSNDRSYRGGFGWRGQELPKSIWVQGMEQRWNTPKKGKPFWALICPVYQTRESLLV